MSGRHLLVLLVPVAGLILSKPVWGEELDFEYAEHQPLATKSLLLDIAQTPTGRFVAVGERGHVVLSDDGEEWRQADVVPTRSTLTAIATFGNRLWAAGHDTVIITSGDDGKTWSLQNFDPERQQPIMDIHFFNAETGTVIGAYGLIMTTHDAGLNWEDEMVDPEVDYHLNSMVVDGEQRFIAGEAGYSYRSLDGGDTWEPLDLPYQGSMWGALAANGCILFYGLRGHVLESCDRGEMWEQLESRTLASISGGAFDGSRTVLVGNSGTVLVRQGRGQFQETIHSSGVDFSAVLAISDGRFLLVGEDGVHHFPESEADNSEGSAEDGS